MKFSLYLGRYSGIKVFIHWTFSLILIWIFFTSMRSGLSLIDTAWSLIFVLSIFLCVILHEFGHALTAKKYGIQTKDIILLPIGGLARLEKLPEDPKQELWVALAGPLVNVVIFLVFSTIISLSGIQLVEMEYIQLRGSTLLLYIASANLILAIFNMIPAFPMDGGRVLRALLSLKMPRVKATAIAGGIGQALAIGFILTGIFYNPILVIIGIFIFLGAQAEVTHTKQNSLLKGFTISDAMMTRFQVLPFDAPLSKAIKNLLDGQATHFVVVKDDQPYGTLSREEIIKGLNEQNEHISIEKVANLHPLKLDLYLPLEKAFKTMATQKNKVALIYEQNHFLGILDQENISEFIMVQKAKSGL
ncbi:site-2 protease family protein [Anditalea andensis]|uniref:Zinc metalloprotease n=1 Tax=Anditalea andensis TaxID=1048983 RepID=A0A074KXY7_9BACT|nr:site-2 protease family protein [Anditalea andensis]KEO72468.1 peptidase M50 [Anditalea andensis]